MVFFAVLYTHLAVVSTLSFTANLDGIGATTIDSVGNIYIAEPRAECSICRISTVGVVSVVGGAVFGTNDGNALTEATFGSVVGIAMDTSSGTLYFSEGNSGCIRQISSSGIVTRLAGRPCSFYQDGVGSNGCFEYPGYLQVFGDYLYVAEQGIMGSRVRKVNRKSGIFLYNYYCFYYCCHRYCLWCVHVYWF